MAACAGRVRWRWLLAALPALACADAAAQTPGALVVTGAEATAWVGGFMWPFVRISALMFAAPLFGNVSVPVRVRVLLAAALTVAIMPAVGEVPAVGALSAEALLIAVHQVIIGVAMGLLVATAFQTVVIAGESVALTMGLGFATMVDPQSGVAVPVLSQFLLVVVTLLFLAMGGHLMIVQLLAESFTRLPIAATGIGADGYFRVVAWGAEMYAGAVLIALPALALLLVVNMIIGVMTRTAPQMNIFSVGFPLTLLVGFVAVLTLVLPSLPTRMTEIWRLAFEAVRRVLGG
jgi:flagellar biosynthetic protein FliR